MPTPRSIAGAKIIAISGFLALLCTTYWLRHEVLELNRIGFSADETRARYEAERLRNAFPQEVERHKVALKNYELEKKHYDEMLQLYQTDYESYARRLKDQYRPPQMPAQPQPPRAPEYTQKLTEINAAFRAQKHHYFELTSTMNWIAMGAALALVGGLLYLVLSFVFLIGPAFHSILSAVVGFLKAPGLF